MRSCGWWVSVRVCLGGSGLLRGNCNNVEVGDRGLDEVEGEGMY